MICPPHRPVLSQDAPHRHHHGPRPARRLWRGADRRSRAARAALARTRRRHAARAGPAPRPRRSRDRDPWRRDRRRDAGSSAPPVPRRQRGGRPGRHRRHRRRAPWAARRRRACDARRRRRLGAADRRARCRRRALSLAFDRTGSGPVLVLLHPLGADRYVWAPVTERLAAEREVIAFDLPGFGQSAPLNGGGPPTPAALAEAVAASLPPGGPHHVAGNSLGGGVALELAAAGHVRSVTAIAPAGPWPGAPAPQRGVARGAARGARPPPPPPLPSP